MKQMIDMSRRARLPTVGGVALLLALALVPVLAGQFLTNYIIEIYILIILSMGYNLLFGYTGLLSFGHAAFYGTGAYAVTLLLRGKIAALPEFHNFLSVLLIGLVLVAIISLVIGVISVYSGGGGFSFAMVTFALQMMMFEAAFQWRGITGGDDGVIFPGADLGFGPLVAEVHDATIYYYLTFLFTILTVVLIWRIVNSPYGAILIAIRENTERAQFVGIPIKRYQLSAFLISGVFGGLAGALATVQIFVVSPDVFHWSLGVVPVLAVLIGGPWSFFGPLVGVTVYTVLETVVSKVTPHWQLALGLVILVIVLKFPKGILGTIEEKFEEYEP